MACDHFGDIQACRALVHGTSHLLRDSLNQKPPGLPVSDSLAVFDCHVVAGAETCAQRADLKEKDHGSTVVF